MMYSTQNAYSLGVVLLQTHYKRERVTLSLLSVVVSTQGFHALHNLPGNWYKNFIIGL